MVAVAIMLLAVADVWFTGYGVASGYVAELNPIFASAFEWNLLASLSIAILINALAVGYLVWASTRRPYVRYVLWAMLAVRLVPVAVHVYWLRLAGYIPV